jgi:hypothetical protein
MYEFGDNPTLELAMGVAEDMFQLVWGRSIGW